MYSKYTLYCSIHMHIYIFIYYNCNIARLAIITLEISIFYFTKQNTYLKQNVKDKIYNKYIIE